jgi:hypothetical protein
MVVKRKKVGNVTITTNTKTGRQTTSRRNGNITFSQSNQGHNRSTITTNYGNGWFDRKTTNHNKKTRPKKSDWSWLFGRSKRHNQRKINKVVSKGVEHQVEQRLQFVGPPYPIFYVRKTFKQFTAWEWCKWLIISPFRAIWFFIKWYIIIYILVHFSMYIFSLF